MTLEQTGVLRRLGVVAAVFCVVVFSAFFVYRPPTPVIPAKIERPAKLKQQSVAVVAVFRAGEWLIDSNANGQWDGPAGGDTVFKLGQAGDIPLTGLWEAASGSSVGVFSSGRFLLLTKGEVHARTFGDASAVPVMGDWTGDGTTKIGTFQNGFWLLDRNGNGHWDGPPVDGLVAVGGVAGDIPVVGDWNGDGRTKVGVYREPGQFHLDYNGSGTWDATDPIDLFGQKGDLPVVGDWNGDGRTKIGVYRNGSWLLDYNGNGRWDKPPRDRLIALGGTAGDVPVTGDWNGDGRTKTGVYRQGAWLIDYAGNSAPDKPAKVYRFGLPNDIPVVLNFGRGKK